MWLVLTEPYDEAGAWLADGLRSHAPFPVTLLTTREITQGAQTTHGSDDGREWFRIQLYNDIVIDSRELRGVVNRVCALPPGLAFRLQAPQRDYAEQNFGLPLLHLLHGFPGPVLNRPTPQGISGDFRLDFEWSALATQVGFSRTPARQLWNKSAPHSRSGSPEKASAVTGVVVVGDQVVPLNESTASLPPFAVSCCRRLAALSRSTLLGLELTRTSGEEWQFLRASLRPNLTPGGARVLAAVARVLSSPEDPSVDSTLSRPQGLTAKTHGAVV